MRTAFEAALIGLAKKIPGHCRGPVGSGYPGEEAKTTQANEKRFGLIAAKKPSMERVLRELKVRFTTTKVTSWQRVQCPVCGHHEAYAILFGRRGEGSFVCNGCGTKGDSISLYRSATGRGFREACAHFDAWGEL
jgi:predicted RNA-binding Zn-ribbon protein involved in translation (DUF1610 family)